MHHRHLILIALLLVGAAALAGCTSSDQPADNAGTATDEGDDLDSTQTGANETDDSSTVTEEEPPEPGAKPEAVRVTPDTDSPSVKTGEPITFEGKCENPGWILDRGEWSLQRPTESYPMPEETVDAAKDAHPWGPKALTTTFEDSGQGVVKWSCLDTQDRSNSILWMFTVETPEPPSAERVNPASETLKTTPGDTVSVEAQCGNPEDALDYATWDVQRPGASDYETVRNDSAQLQEDPWGPKSWSFTFDETGDAAIRWTCVDEWGASDQTSWTVKVTEPYRPYSSDPFETQSPNGDLAIHFVDVGQGDATVLHFPDATIVYDAGRWSGEGETALHDHLQAEGITEVHSLVLSHPDADHTGGCDEVLGAFDVQYVWRPGIGSDTQTWSECQTAIDNEGAPEYTDEVLDPGHYLDFSSYASTQLLHVDAAASDANAGSLALRVDYGDFELDLTGDITCSNEDEILNSGYGRDVELLKVAHHGSDTSTCNNWLDSTSPELSLIGVGADNTYGHPTDEVLTRLTDHNTDIYRTDQHGDISVTTDGTDWSVTTESGDGPYEHSTDDESDDSTDDGTSGADIVISDVQYDASGNDYDNLNDEWVKVSNQGDAAQDMGGWILEDEASHTYTFPDSFSLDAGNSVKIHTGSGEDSSTDLYWGEGAPVWNNGGDTAYLNNTAGDAVDSYSWY